MFKSYPVVKAEEIKTLQEIMVGPRDQKEYFLGWAATIKKCVPKKEKVYESESYCYPEHKEFVDMEKMLSCDGAKGLFSAHWTVKTNDYPEACPESERDNTPYPYPIVTAFTVGFPLAVETFFEKFTQQNVPFISACRSERIYYYEIWINPNHTEAAKILRPQFKKYELDEAKKLQLNAVTIRSRVTTMKEKTLCFNENFRIII